MTDRYIIKSTRWYNEDVREGYLNEGLLQNKPQFFDLGSEAIKQINDYEPNEFELVMFEIVKVYVNV